LVNDGTENKKERKKERKKRKVKLYIRCSGKEKKERKEK